MKTPHAIPVFIITSFVLGIILGFYIDLRPSLIYGISGAFFAFFLFSFFRANRLFIRDCVFGVSALLMLLTLGFLNTKIHQPKYNQNHYIHQNLQKSSIVKLSVKERLTPHTFQNNYIAEIHQLDGQAVQGKILLSINKDSLHKPLKADDYLFLKAKLNDIFHPHNPYQFNYANYMAEKNILKQVRVSSGQLIKLPTHRKTVLGITAKWRRNIETKLKSYDFSPDQHALMDALLLGKRAELSKDIYTQFVDAGVVHVLALSGLHVGILLLFFMILLKPLTYLPQGNVIRTILVILILWTYACIVGLSPSILRAVTMFSFLSLGLFFKRRVFTLNMLCLSAVILLLYNPNFIFDVGFQLSYTAVLSILIFQSKIFNLFKLRHKALRYIWEISSVTLAAQLGVLPLSLFYFHQFPGLFFVSNLLIIPFMGIILGLGVVVLIMANIGYLPPFLVKMYGKILDALLYLVHGVADKEAFLFRHIHFSPAMLIFSCLAISLLAFIIYKKRKIYVFLFLFAIIAVQLTYLYEYQKISKERRFYIFHKSRHSVLGFQNGHQLQLQTDQSPMKNKIMEMSFLQGLQDAKNFKKAVIKNPIKNIYLIGKHRLFIIDSTGIGRLPENYKISAILLRNSPKINLERVLNILNPKRIIVDGSNYKSMVSLWRETCLKKGIPFHYTGREGAFIWSY